MLTSVGSSSMVDTHLNRGIHTREEFENKGREQRYKHHSLNKSDSFGSVDQSAMPLY